MGCRRTQPSSTASGTTPFYTPDMDNHGQNTSLKRASQWLESILDPLLNDTEFMRDVLIVVTFDESASPCSRRWSHLYRNARPDVKARRRQNANQPLHCAPYD